MTTISLLDAAAEFVRETLKDVVLTKNTRKELGYDAEARAEAYIGYIPEKEGEYKAAPYVLIQAVTGEDDEEKKRTVCNLRAVIVCYFANEAEGRLGVIEIIDRLRIALRRAGVLNGQYGIGKIEWMLYPQDCKPYYIGEMTVAFEMQNIKRTDEGVCEWLNNGE